LLTHNIGQGGGSLTTFTTRYEIQKELGRGGMATVFLGYDRQFNRQVALKTLPQEFLHDPTFRARFQREAQIIASLEHPAIVPVYDFGEANSQPFLVMRYLPGGSMEDKLKQRPSITWLANSLKRVALAIDHAHIQGVIHRDIKPGNILFDTDENAYLSDFGIATLFNSSISLTKGLIGTPAYMSPEQAKGEALSPASDLYSLGALLYHLFAGKTPYQSDTPMGMAMRHITDPIPVIARDKPELSYLQPFINKAMAKHPEERFQSARELVKALIALLPENQRPPSSSPQHQAVSKSEGLAPQKTPALEATAPLPAREKPRSLVWVAGAILLAVVVVILYFSQRDNNADSSETEAPVLVSDGSYSLSLTNGLSAKHRGETASAILFFDEALAARPGDTEARYQKLVTLSIEQYRKKSLQDAKNTLDLALQVNPIGSEALCRRGLLELTKDSYSETSEADLNSMFEYQQRALAQLPANPSTTDEAIVLGSVYQLMGRIEHERSKRSAKQRIESPESRSRAIDFYQKALAAYPNIGAGSSDRKEACENLNKLCAPSPQCSEYPPPWNPSADELKAAKSQYKSDFGVAASSTEPSSSGGRCFIQVDLTTYETTYGAPIRR
jgi:tetratricopeptide (TPR) repeat protein